METCSCPGHPTPLPVLPGCQNYVRQEMTSLKLREKFFSFSGDDCTVRDMQVRVMVVMMMVMVMSHDDGDDDDSDDDAGS